MPASHILPSFHAWLEENPAGLEAVVLDVDGILIRGRRAIPGAGILLRGLRDRGFPFLLLTNDGCHSPEEKSRFLRDSSVPVWPADMVSCGHGLYAIRERMGPGSPLVFAMGSLGKPCFAEGAGFTVTRDIDRLPECAAVVVGEKRYDWHDNVIAVYNFLLGNTDIPLLVPNPDDTFPREGGQMGVASGAIARLVQQLCQAAGHHLEPVYLGKPYSPIFEYAHHALEKRLGRSVDRHRVLILGDSLTSDIPGGRDFGYLTGLALTGMTNQTMLARSKLKPDYVFHRL